MMTLSLIYAFQLLRCKTAEENKFSFVHGARKRTFLLACQHLPYL